MISTPEQSSNPVFNTDKFKSHGAFSEDSMSLEGTLNKASISFVLLLITAYFAWTNPNPAYGMIGVVGGLIFAIVTMFKQSWSPITVPAYALLEGLALGTISLAFETRFPGIASQAVVLTFAVLGLMLGAYRLEWIRVTPGFKKGIFIATAAIGLLYLMNFIMMFFGSGLSFIRNSSPIGIGFSLIVVGVAAFNLILDFDFIERSSKKNLPKYMEWYAAFGLLVTLIWLYLELLRLLSKLRSRN